MSTFPPVYLRLDIGAPARLQQLRFLAERACIAHMRMNEPPTALDMRTYGFGNATAAAYCHMSRGRQSNGEPVWYTHTGRYFRHERDAGTILDDAGACYRKPQGYCTDVHGDSVARGIVASLPHGRYLAGYEWTDNGERVWFAGLFDDECDAAKMADEHARVFAESAMEDPQHYERARELEESIDTNLQRLRECIALRHRECMAYVRGEARTLIEHIREERAILRGQYADYS